MSDSKINYLFISPEFDNMMNLKSVLERRHQSLVCDSRITYSSRIDMSKYCLLAADIFNLSEHPLDLLASLREITYIPIIVFISREQINTFCSSLEKADLMLSKLLEKGADMILPLSLSDTVIEYFGSFYKRHVFFQHQEQIRHRSTMIFRDELVIEPKLCRVTKNGFDLDLTVKEFELLNYLACNADIIISYDMIAERLWGSAEIINNAIFSAIKRLRRKIEPDPQNPTYIRTIYNIGYVFKSYVNEKKLKAGELSAV